MKRVLPILICARLILREYLRSGRILVEVLVALAVAWIFFWPNGAKRGLDPVWFFSLASVFVILLSIYSTLTIFSLGRRADAAVIVTRHLGRSGYLLGLFGAALAVIAGIYVLLSQVVIAVWFTRPHTLSFATWATGSLALLSNGAAVAAFVALLAPLTLPTWPRLGLLAALLLGLSRDADLFGPAVSVALRPALTLLQLPLVPIVEGFAVPMAYSAAPALGVVLLEQAALVAALLAVALAAIQRRQLLLRS